MTTPARRAAVESLVDLLPLLFIGLYYLLAGRRRANQKRAQQRAQAPDREPVVGREAREPSPFESFLGQLEEAMAEAAGEPDGQRSQPLSPDPPPVEPARLPEPRPTPTVPSLEATDAEFRPASGSFDSTAPVDHVAHGLAAPSAPQFGPGNPLSEESFERAPALAEPAGAPSRDYDPHGLRRREPARPTRRRPTAGADWRRRLADPQAAQDAFVLQTVFGTRGGRRAERHR